MIQPHQQRVIDEQSALDEKIDKLHVFFETDTCASLPADEQLRLNRQYGAMIEYSKILGERIAVFPKEGA